MSKSVIKKIVEEEKEKIAYIFSTQKQEIGHACRPPGIIPEFIWVEQRVKELQEAIQISAFTNCEVWIEEWNRHVNWLMNRKKENNVPICKNS